MANIDKKTVERVAHLVRIGMDAAEIERFTKELEKITDFIEELNAVKTDDVEPIGHVTGMQNALRADEDTEPLPGQNHDLLEEQAPGHVGKGEIRVPRILSE